MAKRKTTKHKIKKRSIKRNSIKRNNKKLKISNKRNKRNKLYNKKNKTKKNRNNKAAGHNKTCTHLCPLHCFDKDNFQLKGISNKQKKESWKDSEFDNMIMKLNKVSSSKKYSPIIWKKVSSSDKYSPIKWKKVVVKGETY